MTDHKWCSSRSPGTPRSEARGDVPAEHLAWARRWAAVCCRRHHINDCDAEDIQQEALLAVCHCWPLYDARHGISFRQYAWRRVLGAMIDAVYREVGRPGSRKAGARMVSLDQVGELAGR